MPTHLSTSSRLLKRTLLVSLMATALPLQAVQLQTTLLPSSPGHIFSQAVAINAQGNIVGNSIDASGESRGWYWSASAGLQSIGRPSHLNTAVAAINDAGVAVGVGSAAGGDEAFSWTSAGGLSLLGPQGRALSTVQGINNGGLIVGAISSPEVYGLEAAIIYPRDTRGSRLGNFLPSFSTIANAVSESGTVVGKGSGAAGSFAFAWTPEAGLRPLEVPAGATFSDAVAVNRRNDVIGRIVGADGVARSAVWFEGGGAATLLPARATSSAAMAINDVGQVVGANTNENKVGRAFLWSRASGMVDLNELLVPGSGADIASARGINANGQIVGHTATGRAVLLTPTGTLNWQGLSGGSFSDAARWEYGFTPSRLVDVVVAGPATQTVTLSADVTVKSLTVGSAGGGRTTLALQAGALLTPLSGTVLIEASGTLTGDGRIQGRVLNRGTLQAGHMRIDGGLENNGIISGGGRIDGSLANAAAMRLSGGQTLVLSSTAGHVNTGRIELRGGELEVNGSLVQAAGGRVLIDGGTLRANDGLVNRGTLEFGFGGGTVNGAVSTVTGGRIVVSGNARATFTDAVEIQSGGELRVATGSQALFFGLVRQRNGATFSGSGTKFYEGGLVIGDSPGIGTDEGSIEFGSGNVYEAEIGRAGFDQLHVAGNLHFGGTLKLVAWEGFAAQAGQRFDLFDWGSSSGTFDSIDGAGLALVPGLALDLSRLYVDGSIGVSAVPEPGVWALMVSGLALLGARCRKRAAR